MTRMSGRERGNCREGRLRLLGRPAHHEVGLLVDQERETLSHDGVVIDHEHPVTPPDRGPGKRCRLGHAPILLS